MIELFIDIETVKGGTFYDEELQKSVAPPANYTKEESIAKWWAEQGENKRLSASNASALMPAYAKVCCIAAQIDLDAPVTFYGTDEYTILTDFSVYLLQNIAAHDFIWIGHNIRNFDLPVLRWAFMRNDINCMHIPRIRKYDDNIYDTLEKLAGRDFKGYGLNNMCKVLGLGEKPEGMDGSCVQGLYDAGELDRIAEYCLHDLELTTKLYDRIERWF